MINRIITLLLLAQLRILGQASPESVLLLDNSLPIDGPNTYYDITSTFNTWVGIGGSFTEWETVTFAQAGTVTKLRIRSRGGLSDQTVKLGLFTSAGTSLTSGVSGTIAASSGEAWYEVTVSPVSVSATTYKIGVAASGSIEMTCEAGQAGFTSYDAIAYGSFPPGSLPAPAGTMDVKPGLGAYVD